MAKVPWTYRGARRLVVNGHFSGEIRLTSTIVAGCGFATSILKGLLADLITSIDAISPQISTRNVVDDVSWQVVGSQVEAPTLMKQATLMAIKGFKELRLPLSKDKMLYMLDDAEGHKSGQGSRHLERFMEAAGFARTSACKFFGIDLSQGKRRSTKVRDKRAGKFRLRCVKKIAGFKRGGGQADKVVAGGALAQLLHGCSVVGVSTGKLALMRSAAATAVSGSVSGSVGLRLLVSQAGAAADPARPVHVEPIKMWAKAIWSERVPLAKMQQALENEACRLKQKERPWNHMFGAAGTLLMTLSRLGCSALSARILVTEEGVELDLKRFSPAAVGKFAERAVERWTWGQIGKKDELKHLSHGGWLQPLRNLSFPKKSDRGAKGGTSLILRKTTSKKHVGYVKSVVGDKQWPQKRVAEAGFASIEAGSSCQLCGCEGTLGHRHWDCPAWTKTRSEHSTEELRRDIGVLGFDSLLGSRLLAPDPGDCLEEPCKDKPFLWALRPVNGYITGNVYLDGSGVGVAPYLRTGWGLVMLENGVATATAYGAVPDHDVFQTVAYAELYALVSALEVALPPTVFYTDCQYVFDGVQAGRLWGGHPSRQHGHLWQRLWALEADYGELVVRKVVGHLTQADIQAGRGRTTDKIGNDLADMLAKRGARLHPRPARFEQAIRLAGARLQETARLVAAVGSKNGSGPKKTPYKDSEADAKAKGGRPSKGRPAREKRRLAKTTSVRLLEKVALRKERLHETDRPHRVWRSSLRSASGHDESNAVVWCSACGAFAQDRKGKAQFLFGSCASTPPSSAMRTQLKLLKRGIHPACLAKSKRGEGEGSRRQIGRAVPVAHTELEAAKSAAANKREAFGAKTR